MPIDNNPIKYTMYITSWHKNGNPNTGRVFYLNRLYFIVYSQERIKLRTITCKENENINKDNYLKYCWKKEDIEEIERNSSFSSYFLIDTVNSNSPITSIIYNSDLKPFGKRYYQRSNGIIFYQGDYIKNISKYIFTINTQRKIHVTRSDENGEVIYQ